MRTHSGNSGLEAETGILVAGVGSFGSRRAMAAARAKNCRLIAVTDSDHDAARRLADRLDCEAVSSLEEGLRLESVHSVVIATPHADHDDSVRRALDAGKNVLCEKPLSIDPDEARDLARHADALGLRLATGFNHRFYAPVRDALRLVSAWKIGRVESVRCTIGHMASPEFLASWHTDRSVAGGGTLMDNGPHACDLVRKFLGEVAAAEGYVRDSLNLPFGVESEAFALFRNHERGVAEVRSSWTLESGYLTIEVRGHLGSLKVETAPWRLSGRLGDGTRIDRHYFGERFLDRAHQARFGCERSLVLELESFTSPDSDHPRANASGWDGARATEMIDAVYRSAQGGAEVSLTPPISRVASPRYREARAS